MARQEQKPDFMTLAMYAGGFQVSKILLLANDLNLFTVLAARPLTVIQVTKNWEVTGGSPKFCLMPSLPSRY
jgi:hypothetical protein